MRHLLFFVLGAALLWIGESVYAHGGEPADLRPGERLVTAAVEAGHAVCAVPGPSAPLAALSVSGLPAVPFSFVGFLPRRAGERDALLESLRERPETLVFFESPKRLAATLRRLAEVLGDRAACVARELTKLHEEAARGPLSELAERFAAGTRGEVTLVVAGAAPEDRAAELDAEALDAEIRSRIAAGESSRAIAAELAPRSGLRRRDVYARSVALREDG